MTSLPEDNLGYEIDFLAVGEAGDSGDAIALRYGNLFGERHQQRVVLIDGGYADTADSVAAHIRRWYSTNRIDLVVSTHPHQDHIGGLHHILESFQVDELWMHRPSRRERTLRRLARSIQERERERAFTESVEAARDLEETALQNNVNIEEPFAGASIDGGSLTVVGPTEHDYSRFLQQAQEDEERRSLLGHAIQEVREAADRLMENWGIETLTDEGITSPINNTSAIVHLAHNGRRILLTADAGMRALNSAISNMQRLGIATSGFNVIQVPHHGSRRNVGPAVLNQLLGPTKEKGIELGYACVSSAPEGEPKHPAKKVSNAFRRRGYPVYATQGSHLSWSVNAPSRSTWTSVEPLPFYYTVEG